MPTILPYALSMVRSPVETPAVKSWYTQGHVFSRIVDSVRWTIICIYKEVEFSL